MKLALGAPRLLKLRQVRRTPKRVTVMLGDTPPPMKEVTRTKEPLLFVDHASYAPGMYDWACVRNLWVEVVGPPDRKLRQLLGDLSDVCGPVFWGGMTASALARAESVRDENGKVLDWVWWWSAARDERKWEWWDAWGSRVRNRSSAVASAG